MWNIFKKKQKPIKDNTIMFMEECDGYFFENYKKEEALELLEELKNYIKNEK